MNAGCNGGGGGLVLRGVPITVGRDQCVIYELQLTNRGASAVSDLNVTVPTPRFTTYETCSGSCSWRFTDPLGVAVALPDGAVSTPDSGDAGVLRFALGALAAGQERRLRFLVRVDRYTPTRGAFDLPGRAGQFLMGGRAHWQAGETGLSRHSQFLPGVVRAETGVRLAVSEARAWRPPARRRSTRSV